MVCHLFIKCFSFWATRDLLKGKDNLVAHQLKIFNNFSSPSGWDQAWTLCLCEECLPNPHNPSFSMTSLLPVTTSMPSNLIFLLELAIYDLSVGLELKYNFFLEAFPTILCSESHGFPNPLIIAITTLCSIVAAITPLSPLSGCAL